MGGVADLDLSIYTPSIYSSLQPLTSISGTLPFGPQCRGVRGLADLGRKPLTLTLSQREREHAPWSPCDAGKHKLIKVAVDRGT
jgi:hypothetical protein